MFKGQQWLDGARESPCWRTLSSVAMTMMNSRLRRDYGGRDNGKFKVSKLSGRSETEPSPDRIKSVWHFNGMRTTIM